MANIKFNAHIQNVEYVEEKNKYYCFLIVYDEEFLKTHRIYAGKSNAFSPNTRVLKCGCSNKIDGKILKEKINSLVECSIKLNRMYGFNQNTKEPNSGYYAVLNEIKFY